MAKVKDKKVKTTKKVNKVNKTKKNTNLIKFIIDETVALIKAIGMGIFGFFDVIISFLVSFVFYTYWGIKNIILFFWNLLFKGFFGEIYVLLYSCYEGLVYVLETIFVELPLYLYDKCSKVVYKYYRIYKDYVEKQKAKKREKALGSKSLTKTIADYITDKYNNLSFVKEAKAKKEASLVVLTIDPNGNDAVKSQTKQTYRYLVRNKVFPALLVNMIKSAELIGNIEDTLDEMAEYYQEVEDTRRQVISAMAYPCVVFIFAIGIVIFLLTYIVPQFVKIYESMNADLNPVTVITLNLSSFLRTQYQTIIIVLVSVIVLYIYLYKKVKAFRAFMQAIFMKLPVIGNILIYKEMALFARTFATLQKNNVLLTDSIDILAKITNNEIYKSIMYHTINNLIKGEKMSDSFKDNWAIPDVAYYMILTGESTGELASMLDKVGEYYQKLERNSANMIKTFIEPALIVFLAVVVGFILIAVVVPMFGIYQTIS